MNTLITYVPFDQRTCRNCNASLAKDLDNFNLCMTEMGDDWMPDSLEWWLRTYNTQIYCVACFDMLAADLH